MPINPNVVGMRSDPREFSWTSKDAILYALGVGAGVDDPTGFELEFTTENSEAVVQRVLPTFPVLAPGGFSLAEVLGDLNLAMRVHGGQTVRINKELPPSGKATVVSSIASIYDKETAAVVVIDTEGTESGSGDQLFTTSASMFLRGAGGWGGDRGPSGNRNTPPARSADYSASFETRTDQALLYRMSGDRNPLHSDPHFAKVAGFPRPILHGLCTYGITGRLLLHTLCRSDPARFWSLEGRFSKPVFPGDVLTVDIWQTDPGAAVFVTRSSSGRTVIDQGRVTHS